MKRAFITLFLLSCGLQCASAAVQFMTVEQKSGAKFSFRLSENPVVTYKDGNLVVNGSASTRYAIDCIKNYYFTETDLTGVATNGADMLRIITDDTAVLVENAQAGVQIGLLNVGGATIATTTASEAGSATISLPSAKGVYVLAVGKLSFKLIRK